MVKELLRIINSHEIIRFLIRQEQKIQHRDKILGNIWLLFNPLLMMLVLFFVFKQIRHLSIDYCLYLFSGLLVWDIFNKVMVGCTTCMHHNQGLIQKFPLPLSIFPVVVVLHKIYDLGYGLIAYGMLFLFIFIFAKPDAGVFIPMLLLPVWVVFFLMLNLGLGFFLARVGVYFADIRDILEIFLRLGFFLNPVFLDIRWFPLNFQPWYYTINPIAGFLVYFRKVMFGSDAMLGDYQIPVPYYPVYLGLITIVIFIIGFQFFRNGARHYAKYL